jgi:hypothetical protein
MTRLVRAEHGGCALFICALVMGVIAGCQSAPRGRAALSATFEFASCTTIGMANGFVLTGADPQDFLVDPSGRLIVIGNDTVAGQRRALGLTGQG